MTNDEEENGFVLLQTPGSRRSLPCDESPDIPETFRLGCSRSCETERKEAVMGSKSHHRVYDPDRDLGLLSSRPILFLILWYFFSGVVVFLNKYIVTTMHGQETLLSCSQMFFTMMGGLVQLRYPLGMFAVSPVRKHLPQGFKTNMMIVGCLRFATVFFGVLALDYLEVSFIETVKSTAPAFTVVTSSLFLGEKTGTYVRLSLLPVMGGLALCSANELSFNVVGFMAALGTNISECLQFVYSKMLISSVHHSYTPAEVQYYTSKLSLVFQVPCLLLLLNWRLSFNFVLGADFQQLAFFCFLYVANGVSYHFQTICSYVLMDFISPVTHSVANTAKRALIIWFSILVFGNAITFLSGVGTLTVIVGVLLYNKARDIDAKESRLKSRKTKKHGSDSYTV